MRRQLRDFFNRVIGLRQIIVQMEKNKYQFEENYQSTQLLLGRMLANQVRMHGVYENIQDAEFKVFSQFGDDGIIQYLVEQAMPEVETFIEFGVQDYSEANTRFLLLNNNWRGLILDGDSQSMTALHSKDMYWRHDLTSVGAFITRENVNQLFLDNGFTGEIGLLSVDIDGNDYWVWEAINVVNPVIVTVEYNSVFGAQHAVTIPYAPTFNRTAAHSSNLYWGTSLKALCVLAEKKGYSFVGCNSAGNNAHFVRKDKIGKIPVINIEQGYMVSKFRESRDKDGNLTYLYGTQRLEAIKEMNVVDVERGITVQLKELI